MRFEGRGEVFRGEVDLHVLVVVGDEGVGEESGGGGAAGYEAVAGGFSWKGGKGMNRGFRWECWWVVERRRWTY